VKPKPKNKGGRPTKFTSAIQDKIAECFFLAFTDQQTAFIVGVDERTIRRMRAGGFCPAIKIAELKREAIYRQRIWDAKGFWQGAAWMLERKYPTQFSRPEIQLSVNAQVNNVTAIVITAPEAGKIRDRLKTVDSKIDSFLQRRKELVDGENGNGNGNGQG
jgi:hypothetical protein